MTRRSFSLAGVFSAIAAGALMLLAVSNPAFAADRNGTFKGDNGHVTTGGVTVSGNKVTLAGNFSLDGAPDPRIGFGKGGKFVKGTDFAVLKKKTGGQTYAVPASINLADYDTVFIWCRQFTVSLGHASIR